MNRRPGHAIICTIALCIFTILPTSSVVAQQVVNIGDVTGTGGLRLEFWDQQSGQTLDGMFRWGTAQDPVQVLGSWEATEIDAITRAAHYWWGVIGEENTPGRDVTFYVTRNAEIEEGGTWFPLSTSSESPELIINGVRTSVTNHVWAFGETVASPWGADNLINFQDLDGLSFRDTAGGPLDNGGGVNMEAVMIHEIAHALGVITAHPYGGNETNPPGQPAEGQLRLYEQQIVDAGGNPVVAGQSYDVNTPFFFQGANATAVYGKPVPLNNRTLEKAHIGIDPLLLSHEPFRNYIFLTEVELALLQDLGFQIQRQNHFGRSYYQNGTGNPEINTAGFDSDKMYGVGLHLFSHDHTIQQAADLAANGYAGTGIRVDGVNNTVVIEQDVTVTAKGDFGVGVLVSNGLGNSIVHRGTIESTSATEEAEGTGILISFGANLLSGESRSSSTLVDYRQDLQPVTGYLVDQLDITGSISAPHGNAIEIGTSAAVREVNIMSEAQIDGNISIASMSRSFDNLHPTQLNFGYLADEAGRRTSVADRDYRFQYSGTINTNATINIVGGIDDALGSQFEGDIYARNLHVTDTGRAVFHQEIRSDSITNDGIFQLGENADISLVQYLTNNGEFHLGNGHVSLYIQMLNQGDFYSDGGTIDSGYGGVGRRSVIFEAGSNYSGLNDTINISRGQIDIHGNVHSRDGNFTAREHIAVHDGGRLSGTPTLKADRISVGQGGTLAPGNSIGIIHVEGEFVVDGNLEIELTSAPLSLDSDRIVVTNGVAWVNTDSFATRGTFEFFGDNPDHPEHHEIGRRYTILQTEKPDDLLVGYRPQAVDNLADRRLILRTDADRNGFYAAGAQNYYAYIGRDVPYEQLALTANQRAMAVYLDTLKLLDDNSLEANEIQWLRDTLDLLPNEADVRSAFRQMSGEIYGSVNPMILQQMHSSYSRFAAAVRNNSGMCSPGTGTPEVYGLYGSFTGFGTGGHINSDGNASGYSFGAGGTQLQIGYSQSDIQIGGYYNFTSGSLREASTAGIELHDFGGFLLHQGEWNHLLLGVGGGYASSDVQRTVAFGNGDLQDPLRQRFANTSSSGLLGAFGEYGINLEFDRFALRPFAGLAYASVSGADIQEGEAPLALEGTIEALDSFRSSIGADLSICLPAVPNAVLDLRASWMHEFQQQRAGQAVYDAEGYLIRVAGVDLGSDFAVVGATFSQEFHRGRTRLFCSYDLIANQQQSLNTGSGGVEFLW